jgi:outer membrane protein TolC
VIAVGLLFSMVFTLLVLPVLYVLVEGRRRPAQGMAVLALLVVALSPAQARTLTLDEAVRVALDENSVVKLARLKVRESGEKARQARSHYFPQVSTEANLLRVTERQSLTLPAGSLGVFQQLGPLPAQSLTVFQGLSTLGYATATVGQPLTQLWKIRAGYQVARSEERVASEERRRAENEVRLKVQEAYFGILILEARRQAVESQIQAMEARLREAADAVATGAALEVKRLEAETRLAQLKNAQLGLEIETGNARMELNDLLGFPLDEQLELVAPAPEPAETVADWRAEAAQSNPELAAARELTTKARQGLAAARADLIPEVSVFAQYVYQTGVPFLPGSNGVFGAKASWNLWDGGRKRAVIGERQAQVAQAEENVRRLGQRVAIEVEKASRKLARARDFARVAERAVQLREESLRIARDQVELGAATASAVSEAAAQLAEARSQLLEAQLALRLAQAELNRTVGR